MASEHQVRAPKAVRGVDPDARSNLTNGPSRGWRTAVPLATVRRNGELVSGSAYFSLRNGIGTVSIGCEVGTPSRLRRVLVAVSPKCRRMCLHADPS
jgi:hypothetical protein